MLVTAGAVLDEDNGVSALGLSIASRLKSAEEITSYLIEKGANVNARDSKGVTPLLFASTAGDTVLCRKLVEKGDSFTCLC